MKRFAHILTFAAVATLLATSMFAGSSPSAANPNNITATVTPKCTVATFAIAFAAYDPFSATNDDQSTSISVTCTKGTAATVDLDAGVNFGAGTRRMQDTASTGLYLNYGIFTDNTYGTSWTTAVSMGTSAAKGTPLTKNAYGRIPALQDAATAGAGTSYQDTVVATVNF
jgi:spore coat protein U-like protein